MAGLLLLLLCSALVSGSEVAYFSLSPNDRERIDQEDTDSSRRMLWLLQQPEKLLATILISNNFINIAIVLLAEVLVRQSLPDAVLQSWGAAWQQVLPTWIAPSAGAMSTAIYFIITVVGITALLVLFGEVTPKVYATINGIRLARIMSWPLSMLMQVFSGLSHLLVSWSGRLERRLAEKSTAVGLTS
ncbi:MAG: CNNM domain-containing protein, partial [Bacteroidota bacterium]